MLILAIDTTNETGSLALAREGRVLEEVALVAPEGFSGILYQEIQALLERHRVRLAEVERYAAAAGPGSFTGVRVGLTAAKGLAEMHGRMVFPVSNLMAIAYMAKSHLSLEVSLLAPWVDVRRGEVAGAVYRQDLTRQLDPLVATAEVFAGRVAEFGSALFCGPEASRLSLTPHLETARVLAGAIAQVAASGKGLDPAEAEAEYVRHADVRKSE